MRTPLPHAALLTIATLAVALPLAAQRAVSPLARECAYQQLLQPADSTIPADWLAFYPATQLASLQPQASAEGPLNVLSSLGRCLRLGER